MSTEQDLFTLKDIAQQLDLPESTLRKYRDAYPQFIPYIGSGREKRYRTDAAEVFKAIRECRVDRHLSWEDTENDLAARFAMNPDELAKKAVVTEEEANIFIEKVERSIDRLTEQAERQEFIVTTLAKELMRIREIVEKLEPAAEDIKQIRKMTYGYNEVVQRQYKQGQDNMQKVLEQLAVLQGAIHYIPKDISKRLEKSAPAEPAAREVRYQPAAAQSVDPAVIGGLKEELRRRVEEVEKFRDLYVRAKREAERLRDDVRKKTVDDLYSGVKPQPAEPAKKEVAEPEKGGKLFFRGRKKKPGEI